VRQRIKDFIDGWLSYRRRKQTSRLTHAWRVSRERQTIYTLQAQLADARKQLNEGPSEGQAFVWRERLQAAETGLRRVTKSRARLQRANSEQWRQIRDLKKKVRELERGIPDPDDLRMLANIAEWADEQHPERWDSQETAAAIASVRATLEEP
jgi:predicted nuclease with TOPRIM domain